MTMRIAAIELYVESRARRRSGTASANEAETLAAALRADPKGRNRLALRAIATAAALDPAPDVILCPGWTFVGRGPTDAALAKAAGARTVVYEVLHRDGPAAGPKGRLADGECELPWAGFAFAGGESRPLAAQAFATSDGFDEEAARALANALRHDRHVGAAVVLSSGEINVMRRRTVDGRVHHAWDERVAAAGAPSSALTGAVVLNPAHAPAGSYLRDKRRAGPWRALVATANRADPKVLGRPFSAPAHGVAGGVDLEPTAEPVEVDDAGSRVVVFEVPDAS
jgi:hypothetical protein